MTDDIQDRYGLSWQLILTDPAGDPRPFIVPSFLFTGAVCGRADEAADFYHTVFPDAERGLTARYGKDQPPHSEEMIAYADFRIGKQWFALMDSAFEHGFQFNEAVSFMVYCADQKEIDHYWDKLSAVPESEQCGWLKDKFGVSWQIVPAAMEGMMTRGTGEQAARVTRAFLKMKKFDIAALEAAFNGE